MYQVRAETRQAGGKSYVVFTLADGRGSEAEVWPGIGFNCLRWRVARGGRILDLLYSAADWLTNPVSTRSGTPVLFPFPNRIRDGRFTWEGREFQLPINCPQKKHAIHGFVHNRMWRVIGCRADADHAEITGEFQPSMDAPECLSFWPADYQIRIRISLADESLRFDIEVSNPDSRDLPLGLGFHPYFSTPDLSRCRVTVGAAEQWELVDYLPTGRRHPVSEAADLRQPRTIGDKTMDDLLTGLPASADLRRAVAAIEDDHGAVEVSCSNAFREMVVFTPPHRQAICIEPYTCVTDAMNLKDGHISPGVTVLPSGKMWMASVELSRLGRSS